MKKKIITVALVLSSVCAMAQQKENRDTDGNILRGSYETNSFWSNWYIGVGGGINIYEGEFDNKTSVGNRIAPALDVSLGKWITPSYGVRLQYSGLKAKGLAVIIRKSLMFPISMRTLCGTGRTVSSDSMRNVCGM